MNWLSQPVQLESGSPLIQCSSSCGKRHSPTVKKVLCHVVHPSTTLWLPLGWLQIFLFVSSDFTTICWVYFHVIPVAYLLIITILIFCALDTSSLTSTPLPLLHAFVSSTSVFHALSLKRFCLKQKAWAMITRNLSMLTVLLLLFLLHHPFSANPIGYAMSIYILYTLSGKCLQSIQHTFRHCVIYRSV